MAGTKKEFSAVDAAPVVLYALRDGNSQIAYPVLVNTDGSLEIKPIVATGISDGRKTVTTAGTRVQLTTASTICLSVTLTALLENTGIICVGGSTIVASASTRTGIPLRKGDSVVIEVDNLNKVYIDSTVNGEGVSYYYKT